MVLRLNRNDRATDDSSMTAPRICRACGAPLSGDVRWCLRCYEPARELTPRAAVWEPGSFVDAPTVSGPSVAHSSRWEKSVTTFGPVGRIGWTCVVALFVLSSATGSPLLLLFELPIAVVVLRGVWAKGWVVPQDSQSGRRRHALPDGHPSSWLEDIADIKQTIWLTLAGLVVMGSIMYGPPVVKFAAIATAIVAGCVAFFRGPLGRA